MEMSYSLCSHSCIPVWVALVAVEYLPLSEVNQPYLSLNIGVLLSSWKYKLRLQQAGYDTYYTGKLMKRPLGRQLRQSACLRLQWIGFRPGSIYLRLHECTYQRNHDPPVSYLGRHTTEVLREKAMGFLEDALDGERPFFLAVAPIVPHSNMNGTYGGGAGPMWMDEPIPEDRTNICSRTPRSADSLIHPKKRLRALQGVDELVDQLITRLEQSDKLENTFDEDIRVPFFIRSPGIPEGAQQDIVTTHIDVATHVVQASWHVAVEYWGQAMLEGGISNLDMNPDGSKYTYKAVRILSNEYSLYYSVWCNNEHELYDPTRVFHSMTDPYQINNLHPSARKGQADKHRIMGFDITQSSMGRVLHPDGSVHNLLDALDHKYDAFYRDQFKVSFDRCEYGYVIDAEGRRLRWRTGMGMPWRRGFSRLDI
ncbi:alkaline phosphatase-like protein [Aspergillus novofumigatus IBT 16806]|uniref:Alkaline phosphatase-like protein n=1 Tax=Aspergillus novofumigatus (strain IBT 16806) TaxID=1392255 RepID=A0A2I1BS47_ASPN1|nr:alkaline phosphatase-like protein [Aspergillus novofumigatus IBT 16806]PKX88203.1 alkaline phosphatase-like protein [Aspergillus novofumigatus IBT 16806]